MRLNSHKIDVSLVLSWIIVILSLSIILLSGLYSDDYWNFLVRKSLGYMSFTDMLSKGYGEAMASIHSGRMTPIAFFFREFYYWASPTVLVFKCITLFINLAAVYTFTLFLRSMGLAVWIPVSLVIYSSLIQFYINYHDAYTSLHVLYPTLMVLCWFAVIAFIGFMNKKNPLLLLASFFLTAICVLYSEMGLILFPVIFFIILGDSTISSFRKSVLFSPFVLLFVLYFLATAFVRQHAINLYQGVSMSLDIYGMCKVYFVQLFATLPFKSILKADVVADFFHTVILMSSPVWLLILFSFTAFIYYTTFKTYTLSAITDRRKLLPIGLVLMFIPPAILMPSVKYQIEMSLGVGYLPIYIQNFGLTLLALLYFDYLIHKYPAKERRIKYTWFTITFLFSLSGFWNNYAMITSANKNTFIPVSLYCKSIKAGILDQCPTGSKIVFRTVYVAMGWGDMNTRSRILNKRIWNLSWKVTGKAIKAKPKKYIMCYSMTGKHKRRHYMYQREMTA